jgi:hypothetical protein
VSAPQQTAGVNPTWSFVTTTYNSSAALTEYWTSPPPSPHEWIVVDNASSDGSAELGEHLGASRVVARDTNDGFGTGNNVGLAIATGAIVCFVNPDVTVDFSSLGEIERALAAHGGLVAPQLTNPDGSVQYNGRGFPTIWSKIRNRLRQASPGRYLIEPAGETDVAVCWVMGAVVCASKESFESIGGWDERFFIYYEDSDIGLRAWKHHMPVHLVGSARWIHGWARETAGLRLMPWARELSSMRKFYRKYPALLLNYRLAARCFPRIRRAIAAQSIGPIA